MTDQLDDYTAVLDRWFIHLLFKMVSFLSIVIHINNDITVHLHERSILRIDTFALCAADT